MCEFDQHGKKLEGAAGFVDELVTAMVNSRIYSADHPRVSDSLDELMRRLEECFAGEARTFTLTTADGYLIFEERPLRGVSMSAARIIEAFDALGSAGFELEREAGRDDLVALLGLLAGRSADVEDHTIANRALASRGGTRVRLLGPLAAGQGELNEHGAAPAAEGKPRMLSLPVRLYQGVVDTLQSVTIDVCRGDQFSLDSARGHLEQVMRRLDDDTKAIMGLSRYKHYDAFTFGHSIRVSFLAMTFARALTSDEEVIQRVGLAGLMHDVGKARVPFEILQSRTRLTDEQRREMELHTLHGGEILLDLADSDPWAVSSAFGHHRATDGGGYPRTFSGARLSSVTRLVKICDVFEALTAERPYKAGMSPVRAYRIMMSMNHFDMAMLRMFIKTIGVYPIGTQVELSDGRLALVEAQTQDVRLPVVSVEATPDGDVVDAEDREQIDLRARSDRDLTVERGVKLNEPVAVGE